MLRSGKTIPLYCATIVLGGYSSHSGKIHYFHDADLPLYMRHHLGQTLAFYASGLVTPSIHLLWPNLLPSELSHSWVTSSADPHRPSSISLRIKRGGLTLRFLSFLKEAVECDGKMRQWRFSMATRCHSGDNRGATGGKTVFKTRLSSV